MKTRMPKIAVLATAVALAMSYPVTGAIGNQGGSPNPKSKACKSKGKGTTKSLGSLPSQAQTKGKKCGFRK
jgi:hypothetical protein